MTLEDQDGFPWTASTHFGWMLFLVVVSFGFAIFALGIYLAMWIRTKGRSSLPLAGFCVSALLCVASYPVHVWFPKSPAEAVLGTSSTLLLVASTFLLRREIQDHFQTTEGWKPIINPLPTFFFSTVYINYCLVPDRVPAKSPVTVLNIPANDSAKITK